MRPARIGLSVGGLLLLSALAALAAGVTIDWSTVFESGSQARRILWELRVPRAVFVFFAGASLAAVGAVYQILFHNPLAEPFLLGISTAAVLGIASTEAFFGILSPSPASQLIGLIGAGIVTALLLLLSYSNAGPQTERIALFGVGVNFVLSSVLFLLLSYQTQHVGGGSLRWLFGQVPWVSAKDALRFSIGAGAVLAALIFAARSLDALAFGDGVARSLGFSPRRGRMVFLSLTSVLVAWLASFTGSIGFVGLVVPHIVRLVYRPSTARVLLLLAIPLGGAFLLLSDAASRVLLPPMEFPIGIVTTIVGGPLFLVLLWKR